MRTIPPALASHLAGGATTLCRCWRLARRDGLVRGFTDHDRDLVFDGTTFSAASGLTPTEAESQLGLGVAGGEVSGALTGAGLEEADIAAGRYDDAEVTTYTVNWADPAQRIRTGTYTIGEVRRSEGYFVAELRTPAHRYEQPQGRLFTATCSADLGDARCTFPLADHTIGGTVTAGASWFSVSLAALGARPDGWATGGRVSFVAGANAGLTRMIKLHAGTTIELWEPLASAPAAGDACTVAPGCDKTFGTCASKFGNSLNFRGFPHIPTPDFVMLYARAGEPGNTGGALDP